MRLGVWELLIILVIVLILFGRGKIASLLEELGKGLSAFKKGVDDGKKKKTVKKKVVKKPAVKKKTKK